ncbi:hypothetical protein BUALT_Bualt04G0056400 [Buddleja alternifolia]|uniref:NAC domain-containing protein n=1 Tax=Buddleja alternifolia TaxID=168488 RepID=A0AAV6XNK4_9LAMI|nr:hypothetical protein BUALT_Bualt04G0056400 [Buddleja alternifolia]
MGDKGMMLPPGFQFDPTDEELIVYFLNYKAVSLPCYPNIIPDLDICAADPWELKEKAFWNKREWYFFCRLKQNRSTKKGLWKEVGLSEPIFTSSGNEVGIKKHLVFNYVDEVGSEVQTNWIMEEYHLHKGSSEIGESLIQNMTEWVLCRVHEANSVDPPEIDCNYHQSNNINDDGVELSYLDEIFLSKEDDQEEITFPSYAS